MTESAFRHRQPDVQQGARAGLILHTSDGCRGCWTCARVCPAKAIRITDGSPSVVESRCVKCGLCVEECPAGCFGVRDDTGRVVELLEGERPVVAILATEFVTALHPLSPAQVESSLEALGFHAVETTLLGEELVASAYERLCEKRNGLPLVRSTCPVITEWVRRFQPALCEALAPVVPPYVAQARLVRELYPSDVAVVYVSPCYARKDEVQKAGYSSDIDAVIDFQELKALIERKGAVASARVAGQNRPTPLKEISLTDGFPRRPLDERTMTASDVQVCRDLRSADRVLAAIIAGEVAPDIADLLNCEGCIDGPAVSPSMSVFAKRNIEMARREQQPRAEISTRDLLAVLPEISLTTSFSPDPQPLPEPDQEALESVLREGGIESPAEALDCGACGFETCIEFAAAVHSGIASWEMCFPLQRKKLEEDLERLADAATKDEVTGLWSKSALSDRLDDEMARFSRYGAPVSLLMLDLDSFKSVNDREGHLVGDQLLRAIGGLLSESIRTSDFAARFGGDEFAVVLPGTVKTEAYAVAEKIRTAVRGLKVTPAGGAGKAVGTTVSIGVASAGGSVTDPSELLGAADRALYEAKQGGRDQVRLAPG